MSDGLQAALWLAVLAAGLLACVALRRFGLPRTHVRDLLHVGAGVWVLGWHGWRAPLVPVVLTAAVALATALIPLAARRSRALAALRDAVSDSDERWLGLVLYTLAFAILTYAGLRADPWPAAAALGALFLGDGLGGAIGRRFGRHLFAVPGGKRKSIEGTAAVAAFAALAALVLARWLGVAVSPLSIVLVAAIAALAEALSPRGTDNAIVPGAVYLVLRLCAGRMTP